MKNLIKLVGIIVMVAVIGFSMAACDDGSDNGGGNSGLNGTWVNTEGDEVVRIVLNNGNFTQSVDNVGWSKGTYSTSGNNMTFNSTQVHGSIFGEQASEMGLSANQWYTQPQLRTALINYMVGTGHFTQAEAEAMVDSMLEEGSYFGTSTGTYTLSGNTLTVIMGGETLVFTRQ